MGASLPVFLAGYNPMKRTALTLLAMALMSLAFANFTKAHVVGTWLLKGTDTNNKWVFNKNDTFVFKGSMASSKGKWSTDGKVVKLVWTHIDDQPVKPNTVKGQYPLLSDGSFQVDNYNFKKKQ